VIFLRAIIMVLTSSGIAGFLPSSFYSPSEFVLFPPLAKGGLGGVVPAQSIAGLPDPVGDAALFGMMQNDPKRTNSPIKEALQEGKYPWYDSRTDRVQPVWPVRISWLERLGERIASFFRRIGKFFDRFHFGGGNVAAVAGNSIGTVLLLAALSAFFACIFMLWVRRAEVAARGETVRTKPGAAARLGDLPDGIRPQDADPWTEAQRRRAAGDLAGAVVCLFAHQLLTLDQMGLIRLAPGRTGRHYLKSLRDREVIDALGATLALFEDVYYGRRSPTAQALESVWSRALVLQERQRTLGARVLS
jgi:Domain of unknown function (DUF4129)